MIFGHINYLGPLAGLLSLGFEARIPAEFFLYTLLSVRTQIEIRIVVRKAMPASLSISNTLLALSGRARGRSSISESASAAAFAFPVAISFLFCNFLHNRQRFSANFGPIILVPIFFCPDFPSFQSFSPLKCAWWDCFRTRVTATLLADRVVRSGCEPLLARSTRTRSAATRFARP